MLYIPNGTILCTKLSDIRRQAIDLMEAGVGIEPAYTALQALSKSPEINRLQRVLGQGEGFLKGNYQRLAGVYSQLPAAMKQRPQALPESIPHAPQQRDNPPAYDLLPALLPFGFTRLVLRHVGPDEFVMLFMGFWFDVATAV